jgi:hypothetical protein
MRPTGPLLTLATGAVTGAVLLTMSAAAGQPSGERTAGAAPSVTAVAAVPPATPAAASAAEVTAYAGRLTGQRFGLVLVVRGTRAAGYLCDGDTVETWLRGTVDGSRLTLSDPHGARLDARLLYGRTRGELSALGRHWTFSLSAVDPAGVAAVTAQVAP